MKLYPVFLLLFLTACHGSGLPHYYAHGGFKVPEDFSLHGLNGQPLQVTDTFYKVKDSAAVDSARKFNNYEQWHFNKQGDVIYRKLFFTDSLWSETMIRYDDSGYIDSYVIHGDKPSKHDTIITLVVRAQQDGRFKSTAYDKNGHITHFTYQSFSPDGNTEKQEFQDDPSNKEKISRIQISFYEDERFLKTTTRITGGDSARKEYFYSSHNTVDSIITFYNGTASERTILSDNPSGDPLRMLSVSPKGDTLESTTYRYQYDSQGNWIRRWEKHEPSKDPYQSFADIPGYHVLLTVRTIIYPKPITH